MRSSVRSIYISAVAVIALTSVWQAVSAEAATQIDVQAQPLAAAIQEVARQTSVNILVDPRLIEGRQAPAVKAQMSVSDALRLLLQGTGLTPRFVDEKTITLVSISSARVGDDGDTALGLRDSRIVAEHDNVAQVPVGAAAGDNSIRLAQDTSGVSDAVSRAQPSDQSAAKNSDQLEEIVVTAEKRSERLQDVPVPVTAINAQDLVNYNQLRLQDYANTIPGFTMAPSIEGATTFSIRGITTGTFENPSVGIMVDDVPYGGTVNIAASGMPDFDPSDLARIEVLRGPQGTLYGAASVGGLLKYVTVDPSTERFSGRIEGGLSSVYNGAELGYSLRGAANVPLSDTLAFRVSGFARLDPGYIDNVLTHEDGANKDRAFGGHFAMLWRPSEVFSAKLSALLQNVKGYGNGTVDVQPGLGDLQQSYIPGTGAWHRTGQAYSLVLNSKLGIVDVTSLTGYNDYDFYEAFDFSFALGGLSQSTYNVAGAPIFYHGETRKFSQEIRATIPLGTKVDWLLGGFYTYENTPTSDAYIGAAVPATGQVLGYPSFGTFPVTYKDLAAFTDLTFHITDRFDFQVGARESKIRQDYGPFVGYSDSLSGGLIPSSSGALPSDANAFTYLVTPRLKLSSDLMLYARLASGYRAGGANAADRGANGLCGIFHDTQCQYNPDKTYSYEIGVKGDLLNRALTFDASLFYIDWKDIQLHLVNPEFTGYISNGSAAKSQGFELSVESKPLQGLTIQGWIDLQNAVLTQSFPADSSSYGASGDRLPDSSRFSGNLSFEEEFPVAPNTNGFVGAVVAYVGSRVGDFQPTAQREELPAYTQLNLRGGVRHEVWTANLYVTNVTDKRGVITGGLGAYPPFSFTYIQPRTVGVSLARTF